VHKVDTCWEARDIVDCRATKPTNGKWKVNTRGREESKTLTHWALLASMCADVRMEESSQDLLRMSWQGPILLPLGRRPLLPTLIANKPGLEEPFRPLYPDRHARS